MVWGVEFLALMLTTRCNLACAYCYAGAGAGGGDMSLTVASQAIREAYRPGRPLTVELAGGEPLLAFGLIQALLAEFAGRPGLRFALQTNGVLLTRERLAFLGRHRVGLGLSLDGPPEVNDLTRGQGARAARALALAGEARLGVNLTVVLTRHNLAALPQFLLFLAGFAATRVVNLDLVRPLGRAAGAAGAAGAGLLPEPAAVAAMVPDLLATLAFINARRWPPLKVREVAQLERRRALGLAEPYCLAARGRYAAVTPAGEVFPCASLAGRPEYAAGRLGEGGWRKGLKRLTAQWGLPPACRACPARFHCRGGCPARRIAAAGAADRVCELECALRRALDQGG